MKTTTNLARAIFAIVFFCMPVFIKAQYKVPNPIDGAPTLNSFINNAYLLCNGTFSLRQKVDSLDNNLSKTLLDMDPKMMLAEYKNCSSLLAGLLPNINSLVASAAAMAEKIKEEIGMKPFKILPALGQIKNAIKSLKESQENISFMVKTIMPKAKTNLKQKSNEEIASELDKVNVETSTVDAPSTTTPPPSTQGTTIFVIENVTYADAAPVTDILKAFEKVSSVNKTFSGSVLTLNIAHSCTTDELADYFMKTTYGAKVEVVEMNDGRIKLKAK